jgi:hypothetical protein
MFHSVKNTKELFYLTLELDFSELELEAQNMCYKMKMIDIMLKFKF